MSELSKQALKVENNTQFPNNNAGLITPSNLRSFNLDMIDSTVNQAVYTTDSGSWNQRIDAISGSVAVNTGSLLLTASFDNNTRNLTFTKGDSSTFNLNIPDTSGSVLPSGVVSGSSQVILQDTTGDLSGSRIDGAVELSTTASYSLNSDKLDGKDSSQFATTGSNTFFGDQLIFGNIATIAGTGSFTNLNASGLNYPIADNGEFSFIQTDGNGNLSLQYVQTINDVIYAGENITKGDPVYVSGSQGANPIVFKALASDPNKAAIYIAAETINAGSTGRGIVLGHIEGLDLTGIAEGTTIYLGESGGWSTSRPSGSASIVQALGIVTKTGSGGKGEVLNPGPAILPNLQSGYAWVGDGGNQPIAVSTGSWGGGGGTIDTGSFATTGSNSFVGNQIFPSQSEANLLQFDTRANSGNDATFWFGIREDGQLAVSASVVGGMSSTGIFTISPNNLWTEFNTQTQFNDSVGFRNQIQVRDIRTQLGLGYDAQFDELSASGSFILAGDLTASLQEGYTWVGDGNGISQPFPTSSFGGSSFPYTGDAEITGSLGVSNTVTSQIFINPQTITGTQTIPNNYNGMLTGPISNAGTIVIEGNATLVII